MTPAALIPPAVILTSSLNVEIPATTIPRNAPSGPCVPMPVIREPSPTKLVAVTTPELQFEP